MKWCEWPRADPLMRRYHDTEWGVPDTKVGLNVYRKKTPRH